MVADKRKGRKVAEVNPQDLESHHPQDSGYSSRHARLRAIGAASAAPSSAADGKRHDESRIRRVSRHVWVSISVRAATSSESLGPYAGACCEANEDSALRIAGGSRAWRPKAGVGSADEQAFREGGLTIL